ncbi:unnamed protein product, partial [Ilex paraguariensis]
RVFKIVQVSRYLEDRFTDFPFLHLSRFDGGKYFFSRSVSSRIEALLIFSEVLEVPYPGSLLIQHLRDHWGTNELIGLNNRNCVDYNESVGPWSVPTGGTNELIAPTIL